MSQPHHVVQERARRILMLLMKGVQYKVIMHQTGASHSHIWNIRNRYLIEKTIFRLNADGKRLMAANQHVFEFVKKKREGVRGKILRELGRGPTEPVQRRKSRP